MELYRAIFGGGGLSSQFFLGVGGGGGSPGGRSRIKTGLREALQYFPKGSCSGSRKLMSVDKIVSGISNGHSRSFKNQLYIESIRRIYS